jgi:hypothetical protein
MSSLAAEAVPLSSHANVARTDRGAFVWVLVGVFFVVVLAKTLNHAMWRDELQAWLIATHSNSITDIFHNTRYEGHPSLWFQILYGLSRFTTSPVAMQVLHVVIATFVILIVAMYAPFTRVQKVLFSLGYFPFFEYATVSRSYSLGVLLLFAACALYPRHRITGIAAAMFLLCQASAYAGVLAIAFACAMLFESVVVRWLCHGSGRDAAVPHTMPLRASVAIAIMVGCGLVLSASQMLPPRDSGNAPSSVHSKRVSRIEQVVSDVVSGYVPMRVPDSVMPLKLNEDRVRHAKFALAIPILALAGWMLFSRPTAFIFLIAGTIGQLLFKAGVHVGGFRHHGHFLILFFAAYWLWFYAPGWTPKPSAASASRSLMDRYRVSLFTLLLLANAVIGVTASALDVVKPFSAGRETAAFIERTYGKDVLIVADKDLFTSAVVGYLGRPVYYACRDDFGSFIIWNNKRRPWVTPEELVADVKSLRTQNGADAKVLLLLSYPLPDNIAGATLVGKFDRSIRTEERFWVYEAMSDLRITSPTTQKSKPDRDESER